MRTHKSSGYSVKYILRMDVLKIQLDVFCSVVRLNGSEGVNSFRFDAYLSVYRHILLIKQICRNVELEVRWYKRTLEWISKIWLILLLDLCSRWNDVIKDQELCLYSSIENDDVHNCVSSHVRPPIASNSNISSFESYKPLSLIKSS